jgi:hypothetical protein
MHYDVRPIIALRKAVSVAEYRNSRPAVSESIVIKVTIKSSTSLQTDCRREDGAMSCCPVEIY